MPSRKLPSGGPTKLLVTYSTDQSFPLALSSFSFSTTEGRRV